MVRESEGEWVGSLKGGFDSMWPLGIVQGFRIASKKEGSI